MILQLITVCRPRENSVKPLKKITALIKIIYRENVYNHHVLHKISLNFDHCKNIHIYYFMISVAFHYFNLLKLYDLLYIQCPYIQTRMFTK